MKKRWKIITVFFLLFSVGALFFTLAAPQRVIVDANYHQITSKYEIRDKADAQSAGGSKGQTGTSKILKSDAFRSVKSGLRDTLGIFCSLRTAWAEEWVCNDPNYPINCNNGVCCANGYNCCYMGCCPSGSLCCPTGCCPAGYPWFCPENNRCYSSYEDATVKCGSILQQCR